MDLHGLSKGDIIKPALVAAHLGLALWMVIQGWFFARLKRHEPGRRFALSAAGMLAVLVGVEVCGYAYVRHIEPNWVTVSQVTIRDSALAATLGRATIVQIADLHIDRDGFRERQMVRLVNAQRPDWIVITGDLLNDESGWPIVLNVIKRLRARHGVWVVPGNTDNAVVPPELFDNDLRASGIYVLRNAAAPMEGTGAWFVGVDDPVEGDDRLNVALSGIPLPAGGRPPLILLAHGPNIVKDAERAGIPLVLAGHTHGGQVGIPWLRALSQYANAETRGPYVGGGLYRVGGTQLYVNRGIGSKVLPFRLLCPPEVTVITFAPVRG